MEFSNFTLPINEYGISLFAIICLVSYYFIFKEHHKRNKLKFNEVYPLVINYLILCIISFFLILFGIDRVIMGYKFNEEIYEVIKEFITGFSIISVVIINFIFYVKKHHVNPAKAERQIREEKDYRIGQIIELVVLIMMFFSPLFNMFRNINYIDKDEQIMQTILGILFMGISLFLLINLNPLDIKGKLQRVFKRIINKKNS